MTMKKRAAQLYETINKPTPYDFIGITNYAEYIDVMPSPIDEDDPCRGTPGEDE